METEEQQKSKEQKKHEKAMRLKSNFGVGEKAERNQKFMLFP